MTHYSIFTVWYTSGVQLQVVCILVAVLGLLEMVINYGEGGGATKWEDRGSETFCAPPPPPRDTVKLFAPPLLNGGNFLCPPPPPKWLKLQATG